MKLCKHTNPLGPFCKDCKFIGKSPLGTLNRCHRPFYVSLTDGCLQPVDTYCDNERHDGWIAARLFGTCGKEGRYFESQLSLAGANEGKL